MQRTATPRTFDDSRNEHLRKSAAFLGAARTRLSDNLPYRSALSDAVEAIRHSLQAYLWTRVAALWPQEPAPRWQEVAVKGSMPDLLAAATEAGVSFSRSDRETILNLARVRNSYTHDSPQSGTLITRDVADRAVTIADIVDRRVQRAMGRAPATGRDANGAASRQVRGEPLGLIPGIDEDVPEPDDRTGEHAGGQQTVRAQTATQHGTTQPAEPAGAGPATSSGQAPSANDATPEPPVDAQDDETLTPGEIRALDPRARRRARLWRLLGAAALLILGVAMGAAGTYPVARGQVALPAWIPFASSLAATPTLSPTAQPTALPTATPAPSVPVFAGELLVAPSACGVTPATLTLRNTGAAPVQWAVGAIGAPGASFAASGGPAHASVSGTLTPGTSVTLSVTGLPAGGARAAVLASGGTAEVMVGAC